MLKEDFFIILLSILGFKLLVELFLNALNRKHIKAHADALPSAFNGIMDEVTYQKSVAYSLAKNTFGSWHEIYDTLIYVGILLSNIVIVSLVELTNRWGVGVWSLAFTTVLIQVVMSFPGWPLEWWSQFRLEEKYGFNRSTQALWWMDRLKMLCLAPIITAPILTLIFYFYSVFPMNGWWIAALSVIIFQLLLMLLYPRLILPLFNKLSPLEEGPLKERLMGLADRLGFQAKTIQVMDGSKRSGHSNAFFTGFGRFRRIVFFDTLLNQLDSEELEAVLAHEIGHYKHHHVLKHLALNSGLIFLAFYALNWILKSDGLFSFFNLTIDQKSLWLPALLILGGPILGALLFFFKPIFNAYSRKHEYEADSFAFRGMGNRFEPLSAALRKLHKENLSNLTPHPLFSAVHYSHPTLLEREAHLKSL